MGKNNKKQMERAQQLAEMRLQPTYYAFNFDDIDEEHYTKGLKVVFSDPNFKEMMAKRNKLVYALGRTKTVTQETQNLIRTIQQYDRRLADMMYGSMAQVNIHTTEGREFLSFDTILKYHADYSREGVRERVERLVADIDKLTFLADLLESKLVDVKSSMEFVFGDKLKFQQFDGVQQVLTQLRGYFFKIRKKEYENTPEAQLYFEYADSIDEYLDKRLNAYTKKFRRLHPIEYGYTEQDMIDAVNQFFGTDGKFGKRHIARTPSGGTFVSQNVIYDLSPEETKKLDELSDTKMPEDSSSDAMQRYCFALTDAIMKRYKPTKKDA